MVGHSYRAPQITPVKSASGSYPLIRIIGRLKSLSYNWSSLS